MGYNWQSSPQEIKDFVNHLKRNMKEILNDNFAGLYIHGSLAMGGFHPGKSDIDVLVITEELVRIEVKRELARFFLAYSNSPYPIEISILTTKQLSHWQHPCPYEFHSSEFWRERYEEDLLNEASCFINDDSHTDADLAAHITIINHRGICVEGKPIKEVFPFVPRQDYLSSILADYQDCLEHLEEDPIYCSLNLIRVYWYVKEGVISSKLEAGNWAIREFPQEIGITIRKAVNYYSGRKNTSTFDKGELLKLRNYISALMGVFQ